MILLLFFAQFVPKKFLGKIFNICECNQHIIGIIGTRSDLDTKPDLPHSRDCHVAQYPKSLNKSDEHGSDLRQARSLKRAEHVN